MDPVSITAGVVGLIAVTASALTKCYTYGSALAHAPNEAKALETSIKSLAGVLVGLQSVEGMIASQEKKDHFNTLVTGCRADLDKINVSLALHAPQADQSKLGRTMRRLVWPLQKRETVVLLDMVERQETILSLALSGLTADLLGAAQTSLGELSVSVSQMTASLSGISSTIQQSQQTWLLQRRHDILAWLSTYNYSGIQCALADTIHPNTCDWILQTKEFQSWRLLDMSVLWLRGDSGSGKSIMSSNVIRHLAGQSPGRALAYMYCSSNNLITQSKDDIIAALLHQLAAKQPQIHNEIETLYEDSYVSSGQRPRPPFAVLESCFNSLLRSPSAVSGTDVVLDGIDEAHEPELLGRWALSLQTLCPNRVKVFITSGKLRTLEAVFQDAPKIDLEGPHHDIDIIRYIDDRLAVMTRIQSLSGALREKVRAMLRSNAAGMFRWVQCQIDELGGFRSAKDLLRAVDSLPPTLQELYSLRLMRMSPSIFARAKTALTFMLACAQPMHVHELAETTMFELDSLSRPDIFLSPLDVDEDERLLDPQDIIDDLGPFASVNSSSDTIQIAHHSVRTFLLSRSAIVENIEGFSVQQAHFQAGVLCLKYLIHVLKLSSAISFGNSAHGPAENIGTNSLEAESPRPSGYEDTCGGFSFKAVNDQLEGEAIAKNFPLLRYAATQFPQHVVESRMEARLLPLLMQLFDSDNPTIFCRWIALLRSITPKTAIYLPGRYARRDSVLYHAAFHNLKATTQRLLENGADVNEVGGAAGGTALHAACRGGSGDVVRELLERGADHRVRNEGGYTAYYLSVRRRAADVLEIFHELRSMSAEDKRELATVIGLDEAGCMSDSTGSWSPQVDIASGLSLAQRSRRSSSRGRSPSLPVTCRSRRGSADTA